ncbi:MAG: menaquinone biosynthetic enzyme MqnA/MqnD family protein [Planctomycetota bacterium]
MLRLGTVPYLNARPFVAGLSEQPGVVLEEAVPAELTRRLRAGALDAALASSVELFRTPRLTWLSGPAITSAGPVRSILLFLRTEVQQVRSLALDRSSRSAAVLAQVCLAEFCGRSAAGLGTAGSASSGLRITECAPDTPLAKLDADAVLRIGDPALATLPGDREAIDLGALWTEATGLPFVYALWLVRPGVPAEPLGPLLRAALAAGLPRRAELARAHLRPTAARTASAVAAGRIEEAAAVDYLERSIGYSLGPRELQGLQLFGRLAHRHGLVDHAELPDPLP